jgi:GNAT superfamily N-acetyltransferase
LGWTRLREAIASKETLLVFVRDTAEEQAELEGFQFREAAAEDGDLYARDVGTDAAWTFRDRLSDSTRCFVVQRDGRLVHATWMTARAAWTRELRHYLLPPAGDAYVYESYTHPEARGHGVYPFALRAISAALARRGLKRVWVAAEKHNPSSLKAVDKGGFTPVYEISYRRLWGTFRFDSIGEEGERVPRVSRTLEH